MTGDNNDNFGATSQNDDDNDEQFDDDCVVFDINEILLV